MSLARHASHLAKEFTDTVPKSKLPAWLRKAHFKMTFYFSAAEYIMLMRQSAQLGSGKLSATKFIKDAFQLHNAEDHVDIREIRNAVKNMHVPPEQPDEITERRQRKGVRAKRASR